MVNALSKTLLSVVSVHYTLAEETRGPWAMESDTGRYYLDSPNFGYWENPKDSILSEFRTRMSNAESRQGSSELKTLQRFAEMVDMIMYLQKVPFFGQYWYYGCWCSPDGFFNTEHQGFGQPVDKIDGSCRSMSYCYECAQLDFGDECNAQLVNYAWHGTLNEEGNKVIQCDDPKGTCERALCECDKGLALDLQQYEHQWKTKFHRRWGEFDQDSCHQVGQAVDAVDNSVPDFEGQLDELAAQIAALGGSSSGQMTFNVADNSIGARSFGGGDSSSSSSSSDSSSASSVPATSANTNNFVSIASSSDKYCCGSYPRRQPLLRATTRGSTPAKQCCQAEDDPTGFHGVIYNTNHQCCKIEGSNASLQDLGNC